MAMDVSEDEAERSKAKELDDSVVGSRLAIVAIDVCTEAWPLVNEEIGLVLVISTMLSVDGPPGRSERRIGGASDN